MNEMPHFTRLEQTALDEICKHARERSVLENQLATAAVNRRITTEIGFFTYFTVASNAPPLISRWRVLGNVAVIVEGLTRPLLITLFMNKDGYADMLEAEADGDNCAGVDFSIARFEIVQDLRTGE